jgi:DNA gyrase subunit A
LNIEGDDKVTAYIRVKDTSEEFLNSHYLVFATKQAVIKKTALSEYFKSKINGVKAIIIREDDEVIQVSMTDGNSEIVMANRNGRAIRFPEDKVRVMGRVSTGVRGMTLDEDGQDEVVGMIVIEHKDNESIMVVSEKGYGKRSEVDEYRVTNRGGKGVRTMSITEKTGSLIAIKNVSDDNDLMIINKSGITIRLAMADIRIMGRNTQGVRLLNLEKRNDEIASVCEVLSESLNEEGESLTTEESAENTNEIQE